ncbi:glycosyltransferase [Roseinatronobacter monicus]|uniref:Glycosyltransferase involved in cell wall biosynthesis n=1 Tax=Roseinatronobacter monicus TaxID=393481 RepID=A0A543K5J4_9RHOB|nr:glycosyltransferase [Roseinatronobacter monicus]TQM90346.1 glycosyltransferase involved in cell wall biosynthesis [Roseinatronobacter monicus]
MIVWNTFDSDARVQKEIATLNKAGYTVHVFCRRADPDGPAREQRGPELIVERFPRKAGRDTLGAAGFVATPQRRSGVRQLLHMARQLLIQQQMVRAMVAMRPSVIHAHDLNTLIPALQAARLARVPLIYDAHEFNMDRIDQNNWLRPVFRQIEGFALTRAARVIVPSPGIAKALARFYSVRRPTVLANWPVLDTGLSPAIPDLRARLGIEPSRPVALYQGGLQPHRGLELLVAAMPEVPDLDLVLMGDGRLREALKKQIAELGLLGRVHLVPPEPLERLLPTSMTADFGVHPLEAGCLNHAHASPNKLFEYLHARLPVVVSNLPGMCHALRQAPGGNPGLMFASGDREELTRVLRRMTADPALRAVLSSRARAASEAYCWQAQEHSLSDVYEELLEKM